LKEKDTKSDEKNKKTLEEAKASLETFYEEYNVKKQERKKKNRFVFILFVLFLFFSLFSLFSLFFSINQYKKLSSHEQEAMTEGSSNGTTWEKINDFVDLSQKAQKSTRDVSRFRSFHFIPSFSFSFSLLHLISFSHLFSLLNEKKKKSILVQLKSDKNAPGA